MLTASFAPVHIILLFALWRAKEAQSDHNALVGIIADKLSKAGWSLGWVSAVDYHGRTFWIADVHRDTGNAKRNMGQLVGRCDGQNQISRKLREASATTRRCRWHHPLAIPAC